MSQRQAQVRWWAQPRKGRSSPKVSGTHLDLVNQPHVCLRNPLRVPASRLRATDSGRTTRCCARQGSAVTLRRLAGGGGGSGGVGAARVASRAAGGRPRPHRRPTAQRSPLRRPCQPPAPRPPLPHTQPAGHSSAPLQLGGRAGRRDRAHDLVRRTGWSRPLGHGLGGLRSASAGVRAPLPSFIQTHVEGGGGRRGGGKGGSGCARGAQRYQMTSGGGDRPRAGELWSWASGWAQQGAVRGGGPPSKSAASG